MVEELPKACDVGVKKNAKGVRETWVGYKLHIDAADGGVPVSCLLTSASLHDSQAAIPLASLTAERVDNLYDPGSSPGQALMDAAYDADEIRAYSQELGHTPLIAVNPRRSVERKEAMKREAQARRATGYVFADQRRYNERSTVERVYGRLKSLPRTRYGDEFGVVRFACGGMPRACPQLDWGCCAISCLASWH